MKPKLQEKLYRKYPKLFRQKDLPKTQTCMCWGISTDDGWYWLIDMLCKAIQSYINNNIFSQVEVAQVKEKFGGLRFYIDKGNDEIYGMIRLAETMSYYICEKCGSTKDISQNKGGWIKTLCQKCRN